MRPRRRALIAVIGLVAVCGGTQARSADEICPHLRAFETAPFAIGPDRKPMSRAVAFHWGRWMSPNMEWACRRKKTDAADVALCSYLMDHTSLEFRAVLPTRILSCYGYRFPQGGALDWTKWIADISLRHLGEDRSLRLQIDIDPEKPNDAAVRISAIPDDRSAYDGSVEKAAD